ncbi:MAG: hypothetical protein K1X29_11410 [Bdellovibrionales bacterium]|nr:hypothetical protein [Bdellovibrionales bacterium]
MEAGWFWHREITKAHDSDGGEYASNSVVVFSSVWDTRPIQESAKSLPKLPNFR